MTADHLAGLLRMVALVEAMPDHLVQSGGLPGVPAPGERDESPPRRLILCGMGGSAIAGDLLVPILEPGPTSLTVWRDFGLPTWADAEDLVLVSSYSGNTEETLSAAREAVARGCRLVALSAGGRLVDLARAQGLTLIELPGGLPPRASLGLGLGALACLLESWGLLAGGRGRLAAAAQRLRTAAPGRTWRQAAPGAVACADADGNPPVAELARRLQGRLPVIFTAGSEAHPVGRRLQAQLNENSKVPACLAAFPELDHNALVGWDLGPRRRDGFALVLVRGGDQEPALQRRVRATLDLLRNDFASVTELRAEGEDPLVRILSLVQYGDFLSCHLAALAGVDPVPVDRIEKLKDTLSHPGA